MLKKVWKDLIFFHIFLYFRKLKAVKKTPFIKLTTHYKQTA